jgi:hypothetical protein
MKVACHQPYYFPWLGYFHKMGVVDTFVVMDDVQFSRGEHFNRTRVLANGQPKWLTIPVSGGQHTAMNETMVTLGGGNWQNTHIRTVRMNYSRVPHGREVVSLVEHAIGSMWMLKGPRTALSDLLTPLLIEHARVLGIDTAVVKATALGYEPALKTRRILNMCKTLGADTYVAGSGGSRNYLDVKMLNNAGIAVEWQSFKFEPYEQSGNAGKFIPGLSFLDILANLGWDSATEYMRRCGKVEPQ